MESRYTFDDLELHRLRYEPNIDYLYRPFYQPNMDYVYKPIDHPGLDYLYKPKDQAHFGFLYEPIPDYLIPNRPPYRLHKSKHLSHNRSKHSHSHHKRARTQPNHQTADQKSTNESNIAYENNPSISLNCTSQLHDECYKTTPDRSSSPKTVPKPTIDNNICCTKCTQYQPKCSSQRKLDKLQSIYMANLTSERKSVARKNIKYINRFPFLVDNSRVETVTDPIHQKVGAELGRPRHRFTPIYVEKCTLFDAITSVHNRDSKSRITVLNSADPVTPGGGYLDGQPTQEASLCRHTLLYSTLEGNEMYRMNKGNKIDGSDVMIFSPDVSVFRDALYKEMIHQFRIDVISATPVDNRKCELVGGPKMMERRIRKILNLAASKETEVLILCPFGCGELRNDPQKISDFFYRALVVEGMKNYFTQVIFAIYDDDLTFDVFRKKFNE